MYDRILIVEDEAINAMWLEMELSQAGHTVVATVADGAEAVRVARDEKPDVVLMDIRLAGPMDGIEAARGIIDVPGCPVVFMSGYSDALLRIELEPVPALGYLSKPIQIPHLERLLTGVE
mgnify:FL=1